MPNDATAVRSSVDKYLVSVAEIEEKSGFYFPEITDEQRVRVEPVSWPKTVGYDLS